MIHIENQTEREKEGEQEDIYPQTTTHYYGFKRHCSHSSISYSKFNQTIRFQNQGRTACLASVGGVIVVVLVAFQAVDALGARGTHRRAGSFGRRVGGGGVGGLRRLGQRRHRHGDEEEGGDGEDDAGTSHVYGA